MIVIRAKIYIDREITGNVDSVISGFKVTLRICNKGYITQIISEKDDYIPLCEENEVVLNILYGEIAIMDILKGAKLEFITSKVVGEAKLIEFKEIYIEREAMEYIDNISIIKEIVLWAEKMENAIIDESVYSLFV